jgi:hypothetical protein
LIGYASTRHTKLARSVMSSDWIRRFSPQETVIFVESGEIS